MTIFVSFLIISFIVGCILTIIEVYCICKMKPTFLQTHREIAELWKRTDSTKETNSESHSHNPPIGLTKEQVKCELARVQELTTLHREMIEEIIECQTTQTQTTP